MYMNNIYVVFSVFCWFNLKPLPNHLSQAMASIKIYGNKWVG